MGGTFMICLFVLLMNVLWQYVDVLVGKGLSLGVLAQFFFYSAVTLVPTALPLAVLLAALITFGNFGERYELIAMKTAGISLLRVMRPLTVLCIVLAGISFYFQNVTGPNASKKLFSLIVSIEQKSPELEIPEGSFYDEIAGYNLYVRHKDSNTGWLYDVKIYDVSRGFEEIRVIAADSARLETTADKQHLYLHIYNGEQFENMQAQSRSHRNNPYRREIFSEKHLLIDFNSEFSLVDEGMMSSQAATKNMSRIRHDIDSLSHRQDSIGLGNLVDYRAAVLPAVRISENDSARYKAIADNMVNIDSILAVSSHSQHLDYLKSAHEVIRTQMSDLSFRGNSMFTGDRLIRKHWIEWMKKITLCLSILIFFFIGAPLGAIIRKGGIGVPVIVSVFTFILFYLTSISGEKMFKEGNWGMIGCWLGVMALTPLSVFFTIAANKDSTVFQFDAYKEFFRYWFGGRVHRNIVYKDVVIDDPDKVWCREQAAQISSLAGRITGSGRIGRMPSYADLFFHSYKDEEMHELSEKIEALVEVEANSRDKVELDLINNFPVLQVYALDAPFKNVYVNKVLGIIFPLGIIFWLRSWLFAKKIAVQLRTAALTADRMVSYADTGTYE